MGLKNFVIQSDRKMINRILFGTEKIKKRDKYALSVGIKFSIPNYSKFTQKKLTNLSATARDLLNFIKEFGKLHNIRDEVTVHFVGDQLLKHTLVVFSSCFAWRTYFRLANRVL